MITPASNDMGWSFWNPILFETPEKAARTDGFGLFLTVAAQVNAEVVPTNDMLETYMESLFYPDAKDPQP